MKFDYLIPLFLIITSCSSGPGGDTIIDKEKKNKGINNNSKNQIKNVIDNEEIRPITIQKHDLNFKPQKLGDTLTSESILKLLFPGKYYSKKISEETKSFVLWDCNDCEAVSFKSWFNEFDIYFPFQESTETEILQEYYYYEEGVEKRVYFFNSHEARLGDVGGGRSNCGVLGAACFEKSGQEWILTAFEPAVDCTGAFGDAIAPDTVRVGKKMMFLLYDGNGPAGGPTMGNYNLYHFKKNEFIQDVKIEAVSLHNWRFDWNSSFNFIPSGNGNYMLVVITTGYYDEKLIGELEGLFNLPVELKKIMEKKDYNSFTLNRKYTFQNDRYKLSEQSSELFIK